jgi:hypothetical protein
MLFVKTIFLAVLGFGAFSMAAPIDNTVAVTADAAAVADVNDGYVYFSRIYINPIAFKRHI